MERAEPSIVVGVDGSHSSSAQAALWAAAEAVRLAAPLPLVLVNSEPDQESPAKPVVRDISSSCRNIAGELEITEEVRPGHPAGELVRGLAAARLIVVGHRGMGGFTGLLLGSIARGTPLCVSDRGWRWLTIRSCPPSVPPSRLARASPEQLGSRSRTWSVTVSSRE